MMLTLVLDMTTTSQGLCFQYQMPLNQFDALQLLVGALHQHLLPTPALLQDIKVPPPPTSSFEYFHHTSSAYLDKDQPDLEIASP